MKNFIEISKSALLNNLQNFSDICNESIIIPVLKSNAYGHGLKEVYNALKDQNLEWLAVNYIFEAKTLRELGFKNRILVVGPISKTEFSTASQLKLDVFVSNIEQIKESFLHKDLNTHVKIDTGMSRQGFLLDSLNELVEFLSKNTKNNLVGICSHFSNVEDVLDNSFALSQINEFEQAIEKLSERKLLKHIASSASSLIMKESRYDLDRIGISLYGYWPSQSTKLSYAQTGGKSIKLEPVLSWRSEVSLVKTIPQGRYVGYGCLYKTIKETDVAVIPVGYYEGYPRLAGSKQSYVLIKGKRCPILGRICMNMMIVDVSHVEGIAEGDRVTLIGKCGEESISASQIGDWAETINYEILTCLNPLIERKIVD